MRAHWLSLLCALASGASPSPLPSATSLAPGITLRWRADASSSTASFRLEAASSEPVWLGIGRARCAGMTNWLLTEGESACSAPSIMASPAAAGAPPGSNGTVQGYLLLGGDITDQQPVAIPWFFDASVSWDEAAGLTALSWTRPLAAGAHESELAVTPSAADGYIWAVGRSAELDYHEDRGYTEVVLRPNACNNLTTCLGHGTCDAASDGCVCAAGWERADCGACAKGFVRGGGGSGGGCLPGPSAASVSANITLSLTSNFSSCCAPGSGARAAYESGLVADLAAVLALNGGRLIVEALAPTSAGVAARLELSAGTAPSAPSATLALAAAWADPTSALYKGSVTSAVDAGVPPAFTYVAPPPSAYAFTARLSDALTLSWTLDAAAGSLAMRLVCAPSVRWCSVGFNDVGSMDGGDVAAFELGKPPGSQLNAYAISGYTAPSVALVPEELSPLDDAVVAVADDGTVTATWVRPLAAGAYTGAKAVPAGGATVVLWASGAAPFIAQHDAAAAGTATVDLATGTFNAQTSKAVARIAHGALMFAAWGLLAPAGVVVARHAKHVAPTAGPTAFWFVAHYCLQSSALVGSLAGFALAVYCAWAGGQHFASAHGKIGLAVVILGAAQPLNACVRPLRGKPGSPYTAKRLAWEVLHKGSGYAALALAAAAIVLGLQAYAAPQRAIFAYCALVAATVALFAALSLRDAFCPPTGPKAAAAGAGAAAAAAAAAAGGKAPAIAIELGELAEDQKQGLLAYSVRSQKGYDSAASSDPASPGGGRW